MDSNCEEGTEPQNAMSQVANESALGTVFNIVLLDPIKGEHTVHPGMPAAVKQTKAE